MTGHITGSACDNTRPLAKLSDDDLVDGYESSPAGSREHRDHLREIEFRAAERGSIWGGKAHHTYAWSRAERSVFRMIMEPHRDQARNAAYARHREQRLGARASQPSGTTRTGRVIRDSRTHGG